MVGGAMNRKDEEKFYQQEGRLPPGQSLTQKFPVLHYGAVPDFEPATWDFRVWGEVEKEVNWTWDEFQQLPRRELEMDVHCVTRWSKFNTLWEGVSLRVLVEQGLILPKSNARFVLQHAEFGYTTNLPLEIMLADNFLLATHFNGEPLTPEHGYPLRGVIGKIPGREDLKVPYFWKGAKWLRGLEFMTDDQFGFWERSGYHNEGDVWKEQRVRT
jgi:DMSO/TMAO reductase YedYZ molybdopterin-dependent catalytic subunit